MNRRFLFAIAALLTFAACGKKVEKQVAIQTAPVTRRDIVVDATATAIIEPINIVEVKSKTASGQITKMTVEVGSYVKPGDLIVQIDTRDLTNAANQAQADYDAAQAKLTTSTAQKKRSDDLFNQRIITAQENETANLDFANSTASFVRARTSLDLAQTRLEDATVRAPVEGTVIEKTVSLGQVIQAGTSSVGGGSTILKMANLQRVRARALVNETDIGQIAAGQEATVTVDAFPDRPFRGKVEKVEPQAVVQQNVTMFPVLISLSNEDGLLKPGMNGEASVLVDRRTDVLSIPNDAVRGLQEAAQIAPLLNLNPDSVAAQLRAGMGAMRGGQGGRTGGPAGATRGQGGRSQTSNGEVDLLPQGGGQGGGFQRVEVTDADCKKVSDALKKQPAVAKQIDALFEQMRKPDADFRALGAQRQELYTKLGVDPRIAGGCRRRESGNGGGPMVGGAGGAATGGTRAAGPAVAGAQARSAQGARGDQAARAVEVPQAPGARTRSRAGLVFVQKADSTWEPRMVRLGVANFDYTEVLDGLKEGENVALLSAAAMQAQRQAAQDRARQMMGGGNPLGGSTPGAGRGGPGGGGPAPAAATARPRN
ncbi:MAG: efflux RND transporter periplasmic adaptor subunit [Gemmatimonadaceae bacterium]|nr:efflux RND transporter periplasmic adaptor subunit [Gemmatimonadaceae bacterium]